MSLRIALKPILKGDFSMKRASRFVAWLVVLLLTSLACTEAQALSFSAHGYYRLFVDWSLDLDTQTPSNIAQGKQLGNDRFGQILFGQQRLRIDPILKINDNLTIQGQVDILDDVLFGTNDVEQLTVFNPITGTIDLPGGPGAFGVTGPAAGDIVTGGGGSLNVRRLWVDILTPIGKFRIGRQPSNWGLGIFQNDGNGMYAKFGDTFDRFLYLGKYDFADSSSLAFAFLADFVFNDQEDPTIGLLESNIGTISNGTYQLTAALIYQRDTWEIGTYTGVRLRDGTGKREGTALDANGNEVPGAIDGNTRAFYFDLYGKYEKGPYRIAAEYVFLGGTIGTGVCINAISVPAGFSNPLPNPACLDGSNDLRVHMGALEASGKYDFGGEWKFIAGLATGDSSPLSSRITQFGFRPDYEVALMLFHMPLGTSPAIQVNGETKLGNLPITSNRVNNAVYLGGTYLHQFDISNTIPQAQYFKMGAHFLTAWAPSRVFDIDFAEITGIPTLPRVVNDSHWYGFETDLIFEAKFFEHLIWNVTGGVFIPGGVFNIKNDDFANSVLNGNPINAIQFDKASPAYAVRSTLFIEF
ncbi:MAG TPA: hypothetical protein DF383_08975 [Deltaproteobacteria bacterium]|nr:hypothetical protein [Deltaproteobacteria bacterium]